MLMPPVTWGNGTANYKSINGKRNYTAMKVSHEFIPYEQALELKELGYNLDSYSWWIAPVSTPSLPNNTGFIWKYKNENLTLRKGKKIKAFDNEWNFIKEYDSINQAERDLNINGIRQFLKGSSAYVGKNKYKFKYS